MKRYLVFASEDYYPNGGWEDFCSQHDNLVVAKAAAVAALPTGRYTTGAAHVVDLQSGQIAWKCRTGDVARMKRRHGAKDGLTLLLTDQASSPSEGGEAHNREPS